MTARREGPARGARLLEVLRVEAGVPRYGVDVTEATVGSKLGLDDRYYPRASTRQDLARIRCAARRHRSPGVPEGRARAGAKIKTAYAIESRPRQLRRAVAALGA